MSPLGSVGMHSVAVPVPLRNVHDNRDGKILDILDGLRILNPNRLTVTRSRKPGPALCHENYSYSTHLSSRSPVRCGSSSKSRR